MINRQNLHLKDYHDLYELLKDTGDTLDRMIIFAEMKENIFCPHCGKRQPNDDYQYPCSYQTADEEVEMECIDCGKKFDVMEIVTREYEAKPK